MRDTNAAHIGPWQAGGASYAEDLFHARAYPSEACRRKKYTENGPHGQATAEKEPAGREDGERGYRQAVQWFGTANTQPGHGSWQSQTC